MLQALLDHGHDVRHFPPGSGLQCMPLGAGHEQRRNEVYSWDGQRRGTAPMVVIQHTLLGEGRLHQDGVEHRLARGQTMLVLVPGAHRYFLQRGGHWEYFWFVLTGREALRIAHDIIAASGPVLRPDVATIDRLSAAWLCLMAGEFPTAGQASAAAYAALACLHDSVFVRSAPPAPAASMARVLAHVDAHLADPLPVDRLARIAGLSRAHFVRQFTAATGQSPSAHVLARRIERIERLLIATEWRVADIAQATGFADANYMAKVFRRHRGMAPLQFRATRAEAR
jgi:AraC family transcriptional regulator